jgi:hypothetical protein
MIINDYIRRLGNYTKRRRLIWLQIYSHIGGYVVSGAKFQLPFDKRLKNL